MSVLELLGLTVCRKELEGAGSPGVPEAKAAADVATVNARRAPTGEPTGGAHQEARREQCSGGRKAASQQPSIGDEWADKRHPTNTDLHEHDVVSNACAI